MQGQSPFLQNDEEVAQIEAEIARETEALQLVVGRSGEIKQRICDLDDAKRRVIQSKSPSNSLNSSRSQTPDMKTKSRSEGRTSGTTTPKNKNTGIPFLVPPESAAEKEWQRQKDVEGASNDAIDAIMDMVGLEEIKAGVLKIKATVDLAQRQGTSITRDRYNVCMLGNPGTGK